jgi:hypothetical protein
VRVVVVVVVVVSGVGVLDGTGAELGKQVGLTIEGLQDLVVVVLLATGCTDCTGRPGDADEVGSVTTARVVAGLSTSATIPTRRTVAAIAPRRAALIGRTAAERV